MRNSATAERPRIRQVVILACALLLVSTVCWSAGKAITGVRVVNMPDRVVITVQGSAPLSFVPLISGAGKYVGFQFPCALAAKGGAVPIRSGGIYSVRYSNFTPRPPTSRVVVNTTKKLSYTVQKSEDGRTIEIHVMKALPKPVTKPAVPAVQPVRTGLTPTPQSDNSAPTAPQTQLTGGGDQNSEQQSSQESPRDRLWAYKAIAERSRMRAAEARAAAIARQTSGTGATTDANTQMQSQPQVRVLGTIQTVARPVSLQPAEPQMTANRSGEISTGENVAIAPASPAKTGSYERKVSVNFLGADINDVLKALSVQSGKNIVASKDVTGNVTVSLSNVSLEEALDYVTKLSGYTYTKDGETYLVSTRESLRTLTGESRSDTRTELVKLAYAKADDVVALLKSRFPDIVVSKIGVEPPPKGVTEQAVGQAPIGQKHNLLVLSGPESSVAEARKLAEEFEHTLRVQSIQTTRTTYRVKFASPSQLAQAIMALVPGVEVVFAPTSDFELVKFKSAKTTPGQAPQVEREFDTAGKSEGKSTAPGGGAAQPGDSTKPAGPVTNARTIVIVGDEQSVAKALEIAQQLDVKAPQIKIDAKISSINKTGEKKLGLDWKWGDLVVLEGFTDFEKYTGKASGDTQSSDSGGVQLPSPWDAVFGNQQPANTENTHNVRVAEKRFFRQPWNFSAVLDALVTSGDAQVLASPSIVCLERNPGVFFVGDEVTYIQRIETTPTGQNILTDTKRVGVQMVVAGEINDDGYITLYLHPEVSTLKLAVEQGVTLPIVSSRFTDHVVRVKNGQTIVIGGLIRNDEIEEMRKVPLLGDLPVLGQLFRHTQKTKEETEIVMFITASILPD